MRPAPQHTLLLLALFVAFACAGSATSTRHTVVDEQVPRPGRIWVHDFIADPAEVPSHSSFAEHAARSATPSAEQLAAGRKAGREIAVHLAQEIRDMGLPGEHATSRSAPAINDLVIRGYLLAFDEGSSAERMTVGLGTGAAELRVAVEGYQMTSRGLRLMGTGTVEAHGSESPGLAMSAVSAAATGNPAGLIISSAMKIEGEKSGSSGLEGRAKAVAEEIAAELKPRFERQHWGK